MPHPDPTSPDHQRHPHHRHDNPAPTPVAADAPEPAKTAGDYRKEDAEVDTEQLTAEKAGIQQAADDKALQQYASEQLEKFPPPATDPLKDREARLAERHKHKHDAEAGAAPEEDASGD
jgi:hypothetical protein